MAFETQRLVTEPSSYKSYQVPAWAKTALIDLRQQGDKYSIRALTHSRQHQWTDWPSACSAPVRRLLLNDEIRVILHTRSDAVQFLPIAMPDEDLFDASVGARQVILPIHYRVQPAGAGAYAQTVASAILSGASPNTAMGSVPDMGTAAGAKEIVAIESVGWKRIAIITSVLTGSDYSRSHNVNVYLSPLTLEPVATTYLQALSDAQKIAYAHNDGGAGGINVAYRLNGGKFVGTDEGGGNKAGNARMSYLDLDGGAWLVYVEITDVVKQGATDPVSASIYGMGVNR